MIANSANEVVKGEEKKNAPTAKFGLKSDVNEQLTKSISQIQFNPTGP
jgi:hypothetical protein